MAQRKYTRVFRDRWDDLDGWCTLSADAQWLYDALVTQRDLTACGVLPLVERRWCTLATDMTPARIGAALTELEVGRYVVIDSRTAEIWVRSFIRYDGLVHSPNGLKAVKYAIGQVLSEPIREHALSAVSAALNAGTALQNPRSEAPYEAPYAAPSGGDSSPQAAKQPKAKQPRTTAAAAREQHPDPTPIHDAAAAAIDLLIEHDIANGRAHNPGGWRRTMPAKYAIEHGPAIARYTTEHPDATATEIAMRVLGLGELDLHRLTKEAS